MEWEIERYRWEKLRACGSAAGIPAALRALVGASDDEAAQRAYWQIDNTVVVQGALYEAAVPTMRCLLIGLYRASAAARPYVLELLVQLASGAPSDPELAEGNARLSEECLEELQSASSVFLAFLESGSQVDREHCLDLLQLCVEVHPNLRERVSHYLDKLSADPVGRPQAELARRWLPGE